MLGAIVNCTVTVKRSTAQVLDTVAPAASHTPDRQPVRASQIQVTLTGSAPAGTVTVSGTVNGVADTEVLSFAAVGSKGTTKPFSPVTTIATSLTGTSTITATAIGPGGSPQVGEYSLKTGVPMAKTDKGAQRWPVLMPGTMQEEEATFRVQYEDVWSPRQGDLFIVEGSGEVYLVHGKPKSFGNFAPDHWVVPAKLRQDR